MLIQELRLLLAVVVVALAEFVFDDPLLELGVGFLETLIFPEFIGDSADELFTHFTFFG